MESKCEVSLHTRIASRPHAHAQAYCAVRLMLPDAGLPGASSQLFEGRRGESVSAASTTGQWRVLTGWKSDAICNVLAHAD